MGETAISWIGGSRMRRYTEDLLNGILAFILTKFQAEVTAYETHFSLTPGTIPDIWTSKFTTSEQYDNDFPKGMLYERNTEYSIEFLDEDRETFKIACDFADTGLDVPAIRQRLYCYRDALRNIIEAKANITLGGLAVDTRITGITPYLFAKDGNYAMKVQINIDVVTLK